uniref:2-hydroxymuconate-6-semialdehyde hydrolase n=1 Tax=Opuntia streptacantha TaxID=393608 RepID=A0A7C9D7N4_OPUST
MIFAPLSIPMAKWTKQSAQLLHGLLSFIVFTALDFMDCVFCIIFAYLDEFFEGNNGVSAPCYCLKKRGVNEGGDADNCERESQLSETLYGDCRRNVFRELGLQRRFEKSKDKRVGFESEVGKREKGNRWSDCGCQSCVSWMKDGGDLRLHAVVQAPDWTQARDGNLEGKSIENVVFLHGFISSSSFWTETVFCNLSEQAKQKYSLFAVDLLGFGRSPKPRSCLYTLRDHVEMIEKSVIFPFELNSFHLVAHSMGSIVALALAAKYPEAVKSVTLIAPVSGHMRLRLRNFSNQLELTS